MLTTIITLLAITLPCLTIILYYIKHNKSSTLTSITYTNLSNKTIWITGASSGIGKAIAIRTSQINNIQLIISARNTEQLQATATECLKYNNNKPLIVPLDLVELSNNSDKARDIVNETLKTLKDKYQRTTIDILINSSGISVRGNAIDTALTVDHSVMNCNYFGTIALCKHVLKQMQLQQTQCNITMVSSVQGLIGNGLRSSYAASKFALHAWFESLRYELYDTNKNIHITLVCPGYVATNLSLNALTSTGSKHNKMDLNTATGQTADSVACKILNTLAVNQDFVLLADLKTHIGCWLYQFAPSVLTKIMASRARKERLELASSHKTD